MWTIDDIGPTSNASHLPGQSVSGKALCVAISADGTRAYVGGHSGVWRSDDGGDTWWHPEWPQPAPGATDVPGALVVPNVHDLLISPVSNDIVLAATAYDARVPDQSGIYRSTDGAQNWSLVHQFISVDAQGAHVSPVSQFAQAPDDPNLIYAAGGSAIAVSTDGGANWVEQPPPFGAGEDVWHVAVGPAMGPGRRVYAVGRSPSGSGVWYSEDGGANWSHDPVVVQKGAASVSALSAHALAVNPIDPGILYLTMKDGSIWLGVFQASAPGRWMQLPSLPIIPNGPGDSGGNFIVPHFTSEGALFLFGCDRRTVCISAGDPGAESDWTRVEDDNCPPVSGMSSVPELCVGSCATNRANRKGDFKDI